MVRESEVVRPTTVWYETGPGNHVNYETDDQYHLHKWKTRELEKLPVTPSAMTGQNMRNCENITEN